MKNYELEFEIKRIVSDLEAHMGSREETVRLKAQLEDGEDVMSALDKLKGALDEKGSNKESSKESSEKSSSKKSSKSTKKEVVSSEDSKVTPEASPEPEVKPKKEKVSYEKYNRANEIHKKLFSAILDEKYPGWDKDTSKAASASRMLVDENFLDKEGEVIESFKVRMFTLMDA